MNKKIYRSPVFKVVGYSVKDVLTSSPTDPNLHDVYDDNDWFIGEELE